MDQLLTIVQQPVIASGDVGTVRVEYMLDSRWDGLTTFGTFFNIKDPTAVYEQKLVDGACVVPWEVLQEPGLLYIGLRGLGADGQVKTAASVKYRIQVGVPSGSATPTEPTPDIYMQLIGDLDDLAVEGENLVEAINNAAKSGGGGGGGGVDLAALEAAVEAALAEAKESGDFDGTSVTIKGIVESTEPGGENAVTFSNGMTLKVKNGRNGLPGASVSINAYHVGNEYTTVVFTDGTSIKIPNGKNGTTVAVALTKAEFSALTPENITDYYDEGVRAIFVEDGYTNLVPTAIGENGVVYYGCGYLNGYRLTSSGGISLADGACVSGFIEYVNGSTIRVVGSTHIASAGGQYVAAYDANFNLIGVEYTSVLANGTRGTYIPRDDGFYELTLFTDKISAWSNASYFRVSCASCVGSNLIVTVNEEIGLEV